jgi:cyclopropane-fatty-acyl-phospholipid synthase
MLLIRLFKPFITIGTLHITGTDGKTTTLKGGIPGPEAGFHIHSRRTARRLLLRPALALGEGYTDGSITPTHGDLYHLLELLNRNIFRAGYNPLSRLQRTLTAPLRLLPRVNSRRAAKRNAAHSYNLDMAFTRLFLDSNMQYSCAYFPTGAETLEQAQEEKMLHLAAKLRLAPGQKLLDIGCGWGGLAVYLAGLESVTVHGLTLSEEQLGEAKRRAEAAQFSDRVRFSLQDYREERERYDRIISVGMFEHVGSAHFDDFFAQIRDRLTDDGVALIHFIGRMEGPGENNAWLNKYIFPGSYAPALSEVAPSIEKARLFITDMEVWRQQYNQTLHFWRQNLYRHWDTVKARFGEDFCRLWEFYLAGSEAAFKEDTFIVYQIQLSKRMDNVPVSRSYIEEWKNSHRPVKTVVETIRSVA